jgi:beta-phosphoglucomutase family hydrolase
MNQTWGAIFDWDGVIVDSSRQHEESWHMLAEENKFQMPGDFFKKSFGMKNEKIIPEILNWTQDIDKIRAHSLRKEALYREILKRDGIVPLPGALKLLQILKKAGVPCVVASSTHRLNITTALELLKFDSFFSDLVSSENVTHGKPNPQVFLLAAEKIQMTPKQCIVFEDAVVGVQAARAAGMQVVALTTTHAAENFSDADTIVPNLEHLSLTQLEKILEKKFK